MISQSEFEDRVSAGMVFLLLNTNEMFAHRITANIFWPGRKKDPAKSDKIGQPGPASEATPLAKHPSREEAADLLAAQNRGWARLSSTLCL